MKYNIIKETFLCLYICNLNIPSLYLSARLLIFFDFLIECIVFLGSFVKCLTNCRHIQCFIFYNLSHHWFLIPLMFAISMVKKYVRKLDMQINLMAHHTNCCAFFLLVHDSIQNDSKKVMKSLFIIHFYHSVMLFSPFFMFRRAYITSLTAFYVYKTQISAVVLRKKWWSCGVRQCFWKFEHKLFLNSFSM